MYEITNKLSSITKLKGSKNYQGWLIIAKAYLLRKGLAKAILLEENNNDRIQEKALANIILLYEYGTVNYIQVYSTRFKTWKILKDLYNSNRFTSKYLLL